MTVRDWNQELPPVFSLGSGFYPSSDLPQRISGWQILRSSREASGVSFRPLLNAIPASVGFLSKFSITTNHKEKPEKIGSEPIIKGFSWDWLDITCTPQKELDIEIFFWVPDPAILCAEIKLNNRSLQTREVTIDLASELDPRDGLSRFENKDYNGRSIIRAHLTHHDLTLFTNGNPRLGKGPFPILQNKIDLPTMRSSRTRWVCILSAGDQDPLEDLDRILKADWEGEIAFRRVRDQAAIQVWTGNDAWDFILALSQKEAARISQQMLNKPGAAEIKSDLTPLQALTFCQSLPLISSATAVSLLSRVFPARTEEQIPGTAPPIMAIELLWHLKESGLEKEIWQRHLPLAVNWLKGWFSPELDQDGDGIPELTHPQIFDLPGQAEKHQKNPAAGILPYPYLESPGLAAVLINELIKLADLDPAAGSRLQNEHLDKLSAYLEGSWDPDLVGYPYRDSHSHLSLPGEERITALRAGLNILRLDLSHPSRVGFFSSRSAAGGYLSSPVQIHLHGLDMNGRYRIEDFQMAGFDPDDNHFRMLSESIYQRVDYCFLEGIQAGTEIHLYIPATIRDDLTSLLPFWADNPELGLAKIPIERFLFNPDRFQTPYGLCSVPGAGNQSVQLSWNILAAQALLKAGKTGESVDLFARWMNAARRDLEEFGGFFPAWNGLSGKGYGRMNSLDSLPPARIFLSLAGVQFFENGLVQIQEENGFSESIMILIRGYRIRREGKTTTVHSPDGKTQTIQGAGKIQLNPG